MANKTPKKKPAGRKAVPSTYIEQVPARWVTFSKRKTGLILKTHRIVQKTNCKAFLLVEQMPVRERGKKNVYLYACPTWRGLYSHMDPLLDVPIDTTGSTDAYQCPVNAHVHLHELKDRLSDRSDSAASIIFSARQHSELIYMEEAAAEARKRGTCFCKRKCGLLKKASQLVGMTGCRCLLVLAFPEGGTDAYFVYASPEWRTQAMEMPLLSLFRQAQLAESGSGSVSETDYNTSRSYVLPTRVRASKISCTSLAENHAALSFGWKSSPPVQPQLTIVPPPPPLEYAPTLALPFYQVPTASSAPPTPPQPQPPRKKRRLSPIDTRSNAATDALARHASMLCSV